MQSKPSAEDCSMFVFARRKHGTGAATREQNNGGSQWPELTMAQDGPGRWWFSPRMYRYWNGNINGNDMMVIKHYI